MNTPPRNLTPYGQQLWTAADLCVSGPQPHSEDSAENYYQTQAAFKDICRPARMLGLLNEYAATIPMPGTPPMSCEHQANRIARLERFLQFAYGCLDTLEGHVEFEAVFGKEDQQRLRALRAEADGIQAMISTPSMQERVRAAAAGKEYGDTKVCVLCHHVHAAGTGCAGVSQC